MSFQRGLGDDCVKIDEIRCTDWLENGYSSFVINGQNISPSDVVQPSIGTTTPCVLFQTSFQYISL